MQKRGKVKPIKIHWVDSWRDFPDGGKSNVLGESILETRDVYFVKGKTPKATELHEIGHIKLQHSKGYPYKPLNYVREEIEASLYSFKRIKKPKNLLTRLRGIFNALASHYKISPTECIALIEKRIKQDDIPETWQEDFEKLEDEFYRVYNR